MDTSLECNRKDVVKSNARKGSGLLFYNLLPEHNELLGVKCVVLCVRCCVVC